MAGNFFNDANTTVSFVGSATDIGYNAYYFMDDFCVSPTPGVCFTVLDMDWGREFIKVNGNEVTLSWYAKPEGLNGFIIERSIGGGEFTAIAELAAQGSDEQYLHKDVVSTPEPTAHYRIRAIGKDGGTYLSRTLTARFYEDGTESLQVFPNPGQSGSSLMVEYQLSEGAEAPELCIFDLVGLEIFRTSLPLLGSGMHTTEISTAEIQPGTYIVKVGNRSRKLVLE